MPTKAVNYRLTDVTRHRIDRLADHLGTTKTRVFDMAVRDLADKHGLLGDEARERVDAILAHYGEDATLTLATQKSTTNVVVSINGEPTHDLTAVTWPRPSDYANVAGKQVIIGKVPIKLWIPDTGFQFEIADERLGKTISMPLAELHGRLIAPAPRSAEADAMNEAIRRDAGTLREDDDEPEDDAS
jgi:predicted transcriptional regulator